MYPNLTSGKKVGGKKKKKKPKSQTKGPKLYGGLKKFVKCCTAVVPMGELTFIMYRYHDNEAFEVIFNLLHKNASKVYNPQDPGAHSVTSNVWLLRHEEPIPEGQTPWNNNSCLAGQGANQLKMKKRAKAKGLVTAKPKRLSPKQIQAKVWSDCLRQQQYPYQPSLLYLFL